MLRRMVNNARKMTNKNDPGGGAGAHVPCGIFTTPFTTVEGPGGVQMHIGCAELIFDGSDRHIASSVMIVQGDVDG